MARLDMETLFSVLNNKININDINIIYDVGCLNGADSFLLSKLFNSRVIGFEGLTANFDNFLKNNNTDSVTFYNQIIRNYDGKTIFFEKEKNGIHSIFEQNISKTKNILENLSCKRMDTLMIENNLPIPDMVKIDVEGATLEVLESFGVFLDKIKVLQIETEEVEYFIGQKLENDVLKYIDNFGFYIIFKSSSINVKQNDYILLNKKFYNYES